MSVTEAFTCVVVCQLSILPLDREKTAKVKDQQRIHLKPVDLAFLIEVSSRTITRKNGSGVKERAALMQGRLSVAYEPARLDCHAHTLAWSVSPAYPHSTPHAKGQKQSTGWRRRID
jgi:hypothetical protein